MTQFRRVRTAHVRIVLTASVSVLAALAASSSQLVHSAPPPGHPTPGAALQIIRPDDGGERGTRRTGVALDAIDANEYTYIEVDEAGKSYWIATARMNVARGEMVQFDEGVTMEQFYSKLLKRTFPSVMFVGAVSTRSGGR